MSKLIFTYLFSPFKKSVFPSIRQGRILGHDPLKVGLSLGVIGTAEGAFGPVAAVTESEVGMERAHAHIHELVFPGGVVTMISPESSGFSVTANGQPFIVNFIKPLKAFTCQLVFFRLREIGISIPETSETEI